MCEVMRDGARVGERWRRVWFRCDSEGTEPITERLLDVGILRKKED